MIFFSATELGFYDTAIHGSIPEDCVEISADYHAELLRGQSEGKLISWGDDGCPVLVDPPAPSPEYLADIERAKRDRRLQATDGVVARHRDELEAGQKTTLTPTQYRELQRYRQALRSWPEVDEFPLIDHRPSPPDCLVEQLP
ncbi:tail fiber assembly protein [Pseudomonas baetica]|uniref:tail fiber assembly protein n=1 Tax=Pseudomonas baetica TaxID=674054 RepID=UPI003EF068FB